MRPASCRARRRYLSVLTTLVVVLIVKPKVVQRIEA